MSIIDISNAMAKQEDHTWNPATMSWSAVNPNSLAQKNNNPGNLRFAGQRGAVVGAGGFAKFETIEDGFAALGRQINLDASRGLDLGQFINKYAPKVENDTDSYLANVMRWLGLSSPNIKLSSIIGGAAPTVDNTDEGTDVFGDDRDDLGTVNIGMVILVGVVGLGLWAAFRS